MSGPFDAFGQAAWRPLVFALLHTLWQGGVVALATAATLRRLPASRQGARYAVSLAGQFGVLLAGLLTWAALGYEPAGVAGAGSGNGAGSAVTSSVQVAAPEPFRSVPAPRAAGPEWVSVVAVGWLAGVALMTARAAGSTLAAVALLRGSGAVDRAIVEAVEGLRRELGVGRPVRVVAVEGGASPAVLGLVWPTIVLPVALMTGLTPEAVRAILAHELAHVRRHDYAVNLAQMAVEALLFFNPSVWWLGRQARAEREACCDAVAVGLTGRPLEYSRVLADWAERARTRNPASAVALTWDGDGRPSKIRERVLRVVRPGETPRSRVSVTGLLVLIVAAPLTLVACRRGADEAVKLAVKILPSAERVEKLKEARAEFAPPAIPGGGKGTLKGTIRGPGGEPLKTPVRASAISKTPNASSTSSLNPLSGSFSAEVGTGVVWLSLVTDEYAPVMVGPFDVRPGATVEGIDVLLQPGFPARVRVVDENGAAVAGASVNGGLSVDGSSMYSSAGLITDAAGFVTVAHAANGPYRLSAQAKGFQTFQGRELTLTPGEVATLTLVHARPTRGVVFGPAGEPVAGATVRPLAAYKPHFTQNHGPTEPVIAETDRDGRFRLDALDDNTSYALLIETGRLGRRVVTGVRAGQEGLKWRVGPDLTITGTVKGDLGTLEQERDKPVVEITQHGPDTGENRGPTLRSTVPVERTESGGRFRVTGVLPGRVVVTAGDHVVDLDVKTPENPVTIDLTAVVLSRTKRRVILRVVTPEGSDPATGSLSGYATDGKADQVFQRFDLPLKAGEVSVEVPTPGRVTFQNRSVLGYWFKDGDREVTPGDWPMVIELKGVPAGAIVGRVLDHDGKPAASGVSLGASTVEPAPVLKDETINLNNIEVDAEGRFFVGPLPIGGTYVVVASRGHNSQVSVPVRLDGSKATGRVDIRLNKPAAAGGRVVGPDGRPIAGVDVTLQLDEPYAGTSWSPPTQTDRDGRFSFDDLNPSMRGYHVSIGIRRDFQPVGPRALTPGGPPLEIRLERGRVATGRVVDAKSGRPIPGVDVYASRREYRTGVPYAYESEAKTDELGRFRFSDLPAVPVQLNDRDGLKWESDAARAVSTDGDREVEIRATLPDWSRLKPVAAPKD